MEFVDLVLEHRKMDFCCLSSVNNRDFQGNTSLVSEMLNKKIVRITPLSSDDCALSPINTLQLQLPARFISMELKMNFQMFDPGTEFVVHKAQIEGQKYSPPRKHFLWIHWKSKQLRYQP